MPEAKLESSSLRAVRRKGYNLKISWKNVPPDLRRQRGASTSSPLSLIWKSLLHHSELDVARVPRSFGSVTFPADVALTLIGTSAYAPHRSMDVPSVQ